MAKMAKQAEAPVISKAIGTTDQDIILTATNRLLTESIILYRKLISEDLPTVTELNLYEMIFIAHQAKFAKEREIELAQSIQSNQSNKPSNRKDDSR